MYTILFPSDYFNRNKIDAELEQEYEALKKQDLMQFYLIILLGLNLENSC